MEKSELIAYVADRSGLPKRQAALAVDSTFALILESLIRQEPVRIIGFGVFELRQSAARKGRDLNTKKIIQIPAKKTPVFRASKAFKKRFQ